MNYVYIRLTAFILFFLLFALLETLFPRRKRSLNRLERWPGNLIITALNTILGRALSFIIPASAALWASENNFGLFNIYEIPLWFSFTVSFLALDLLIYFQHRIFHTFKILKRVHRMHHTDPDIDASTGLRFHPAEIVLSMIIKSAAAVVLGAPAAAVTFFEIVLNSAAMFNHANMNIPLSADSIIRKFIVTPDMHRIHHSVLQYETNSNYGFFLSCWDHIFKSYTKEPQEGHEGMEIGLKKYSGKKYSSLAGMLKTPFEK